MFRVVPGNQRTPAALKAEALVLPVWTHADHITGHAAGLLRTLREIRFDPVLGTTALIPATPVPVLAVGMGRFNDLTGPRIRKALSIAARNCLGQGFSRIVIDLSNLPDQPPAYAAAATGWVRGCYQLSRFKSKPRHTVPSVIFLVRTGPVAGPKAALATGWETGLWINRVRDVANLPGNEAPPELIARQAAQVAAAAGLSVEVWNEARLKKEKCNALLAVGQGSRKPPRLIILRNQAARLGRGRPVVLVGKTITFDTGGISIKPARNMEWMRYDKSGGMAVLAAMAVIGARRLKQPVIGILAAAENMPGGNAIRPGDVVTSRAGKTIEIINTDAEGRLVLADALSVAQDFKPATIVNFATLTGAAVTAVGHIVSPLMGNHAGLRDELWRAGESSGERLWPFPLYPEYRDLIQSDFADLRNTGDGTAGAIVGGMFLREFVTDRIPWAHIDLTHAWEEKEKGSTAAGANLFGTELILQWLEQRK